MPLIKEMFAFIIANTDKEDEGIPAVGTNFGLMPLVGADMSRINSLRASAQEMADKTGKPITLAKFNIREDIEIIHPKTAKMKMDTCPSCGRVMDAATVADSNRPASPTPGDLSVCIGCGDYLVYKDDLSLRQMTEEESKSLPPETLFELYKIRRAVQNIASKLS